MIVAGTTATASESLTNNTTSPKTFTLTNRLDSTNGKASTQTQVVTVAGGGTFAQTFTRKVNTSDVGSYALTFTADDGTESATTTAHYSIVKR